MKIRYVSDIHLEFIKPNKLQALLKKMTPTGLEDVLILAGDIGKPYSENYRLFTDHINKHFKRTYIIAGNHEYYGKTTMNETTKYMTEYFQQYENIRFLNNDIDKYQGITFLGTTLWSHISHPEYEINDIYSIPNFDYTKYNQLNKTCVNFLENAIQEDGKYIIISHHQPSQDLIDAKYKTPRMLPYNQWFYCDMNEFIEKNREKIKCWFYGHTHTPLQTTLYNVPMCCNPIGYPNENPINDYTKTIEIES